MDLESYAPLFMLLMFGVPAFFAYITYKVKGTGGLMIIIFGTMLCMFLSFGVVNAAGYSDASKETVTTILSFSLFIPLTYGGYSSICFIKEKMRNHSRNKIKKQISELETQYRIREEEVTNIKNRIQNDKAVYNAIDLFKLLGMSFSSDVALVRLEEDNKRIRILSGEMKETKENITNLQFALDSLN